MATSQATDLNSLLVSKPGYRNGWPCLRGTGITVHSVAATYMNGWTVEMLCKENPHLDRSLFYAALAYYFANKKLVEQQLEDEQTWAERLAAKYPNGITNETLDFEFDLDR
jgi:uncharacterized protein (DUF433 family)